MPQYLIAVHHAPGAQSNPTALYADEEAMQAAFQRVGAFNESLGEKLVFACGLTDPDTAVTVTGGDNPTVTPGPVPQGADVFISGFWVVEAADDVEAQQLGQQASTACGQPLEVRRLQG